MATTDRLAENNAKSKVSIASIVRIPWETIGQIRATHKFTHAAKLK